MNVTSRLQWRLGPGNDMLVLMPVLFHTRAEGTRHHVLTQALGDTPPLYDTADNRSDSRFTVGRLNLQYRSTLGSGLRLEANGGTSAARGESNNLRQEFDPAATLQRTVRDNSRTRDRTATLNSKLSKLLDGDHSLVTGAEIESLSRNESRSTEAGQPGPAGRLRRRPAGQQPAAGAVCPGRMGDQPELVGARRAALGVDPHARRQRRRHAARQPQQRADAAAHAVWKPDPKSRDQIRLSLTRSYKAPTLQNLVARPVLSSRYPADGANTPTSPDRAGNPDLRPELATGIDVAFERYLPQGGVLSANLFHRRIQLPVQPGARQRPVALDGGQRDAQGLGDLVVLHAAEEAQLHDLGGARVHRLEGQQRLVHGHHVAVGRAAPSAPGPTASPAPARRRACRRGGPARG
jgi:outer membrane receptor for ferrienterochelin and colicins